MSTCARVGSVALGRRRHSRRVSQCADGSARQPLRASPTSIGTQVGTLLYNESHAYSNASIGEALRARLDAVLACDRELFETAEQRARSIPGCVARG